MKRFYIIFYLLISFSLQAWGEDSCKTLFQNNKPKRQNKKLSKNQKSFIGITKKEANTDKETNEDIERKIYENKLFAMHAIISLYGLIKPAEIKKISKKELQKLLASSPFQKYNKEDFIKLIKEGVEISTTGTIYLKQKHISILIKKVRKELKNNKTSKSKAFYLKNKTTKITLERLEYLERLNEDLNTNGMEIVNNVLLLNKDIYFKNLNQQKQQEISDFLPDLLLDNYSKNFTFPSQKNLLQLFKVNQKSFETFLKEVLGYKNYKNLIDDMTVPYFIQNYKDTLKKTLIDAYITAIQKNQKKTENLPTHPSLSDINEVLKEKYPSVTISRLNRFLGLKSPVFNEQIFNGWNDLKEKAKEKKPKLFANFIDNKIYSNQFVELQSHLLKTNSGFIITSATAGVPLDDDYFNLILKRANQNKVPLIILPVNRESEYLPLVKPIKKEDGSIMYTSYLSTTKDEELIPLHEIPNIYVIIHSMELTNYLTINSIPIMAKNFNPFASVNKLQISKGKTLIIAHPQLNFKIEPGTTNETSPTALMTTGSISKDTYPNRTHIQGRISTFSKGSHSFNAWFFSPLKSKGGLNQNAVPGLYTYRLLKKRHLNLSETENYTGIIDQDTFYGEDQEKIPVKIEYLILGDLHVGSTNPKMYELLANVFERHPSANLVLHDAFDGASINHHEAEKVMNRSQQVVQGTAFLEKEYQKNIEVINALLSLTKGKIYFIVSNHPMWLKNLLESPKAYSDPINSPLLTEIRHAINTENLDPFEYLYKERERFHNQYRLDVKKELLENNIYISDPDRIVVLRDGEPLFAGTQKEPIKLDIHGHNISGGRTGVGPSNASNLRTAVIGHTHSPGIHQQGVTNVGTATRDRLPYTAGSALSAWHNGYAVTYENISEADLIVIHPLEENKDLGTTLTPEEHFPKGFPYINQLDNDKPSDGMTSIHDGEIKKK